MMLKACLLLALFILPLAGCRKTSTDTASSSLDDDNPINVRSDDAEMNGAIAKAREGLPEFWRIFDHPPQGETDFSVKVRISDMRNSEHFWAIDLARYNGIITGVIDNEPGLVFTVKRGQRIEIPEADITDWTYQREGKSHGQYTVRVLFKQMAPSEVAEIKATLAEP